MLIKCILAPSREERRAMVVGAGRPRGRIRVTPRTGRPVSLGQGTDRGSAWAGKDPCTTYDNPDVPTDEEGCDIGYNGCGDSVGVDTTVGAGATVDIQVPAAIVMVPRYFVYTGAEGAFLINNVRVANGGTSHFGAGMLADIFRFNNFVNRGVAWPRFYNNPPLLINVTSLAAQDEDFTGVIIGVATHE